jgi:hypothetical protein
VARKSGGSSRLSRREFGRHAALLSGAAVLPSVNASASIDHPHAGTHAGQNVPTDQDEPALRKLSPEGRSRFESMLQSVLQKHRDHLTDDQKIRLRKIVASNVTMLEAVYAVPLNNGDTPATILLLLDDSTTPRTPDSNSPPRAASTPATRKPAGRRD